MSKEAMRRVLEKIATVNAMDYEYQAWAREALAEQPAQQEPVIAQDGDTLEIETVLYTSPAASKPLTDKQTMAGYKLACSYGVYESNAFALTEKMFSIFKENT